MTRAVAVFGLGLVAFAQAFSALNGAGRPAAYVPVQIVSALATATAAVGLARLERGLPFLAIGFGVNALTRVLQVLLDLTLLPLWLNALLALSFILAMVLVGITPQGPRFAARVRSTMTILAILHFVTLMLVLSRLTASIQFALSAAGFAMAASFAE